MIAPKLRLLLNTKKDLQAILKVPNGVPFNQYVRYLAWVGEPIPKAHLFGDYVKGRFTAGGKAVLQDEVGEFTRLSKATNFVGGELVEYEVGEARIEAGKGLLVEPEATNAFVRGDFIKFSVEDLTATEYLIEPAFSKTHKVAKLVGTGEDREGLFEYQSGAVASSEAGAGPRRLSVYIKASEEVEFVSLNMYQTISNNHPYRFVVNLKTLTVTQIIPTQTSDVVVENKGAGWVRVSFTYVASGAYQRVFASFGKIGDSPTHPGGWHCLSGGDEVLLALPEHYTNNQKYYISSIPTNEISQVTRSPDLLRIPLLPNQSITIDADEGLRCVKDGASALISADTPAYLRTFAVDEAKVAFNNYATGVYKVDDMEVSFEQLNEFTRLTAATNFVGGELVEYAAGQPRIEAGKGLLVEPEATNTFTDSILALGAQSFHTKTEGNIYLPDPIMGGKFFEAKPLSQYAYKQATTQDGIARNLSVYVSKSNGSLDILDGAHSEGYDFTLVGKASLGAKNTTEPLTPNLVRISYPAAVTGELQPTMYKGIVRYSVQQEREGDIRLHALQLEFGTFPTSFIKTTTAPATTRSPDLLRLTIPAGKTLTLDADAGISYIMENATTALITSDRPAYIRSARIA